MDFLLRYRNQLLALAVCIAVVSLRGSLRLAFDRSIENMFASTSDTLQAYQQLQRTFGGNEIVLTVYRDREWQAADGSGLRRISSVRRRLEQVAGVRAVLSIDQALPGIAIVQPNPLAARARQLFEGFTHGADGETVSLVCLLEPVRQASTPRGVTIDALRQIVQDLPDNLPDGYITGEPVLLVDGFRFLEQDGRNLGLWSILFLGATIIICFRSVRWVVIPLLIVQWSLIVTRAILVLARLQLTMVSSRLTAVVMVIGVATLVHVMVRYTEERDLGYGAEESLRRTGRALAGPILWSCLTDAVGFLSLTVSEVGPVKDYGTMMAIGSLAVLAAVPLLVPGLSLLGQVDRDPHKPWGEWHLTRQLERLLVFVRQRPRRTLGLLTVITVWAMIGLGHLPVETDFTKNFRHESDIRVSYQFVEEHLGGAGVCDVILPAPEQLDWPYLERVLRLAERIQQPDDTTPTMASSTGHVTKAMSVAHALEGLAPVDLAQQPPWLRDRLIASGLSAMRGWMPAFYAALDGRDPHDQQRYLRLMLRVPERQSAVEKQRLIRRIDRLAREIFPDRRVRVTGYFVLLSQLIDSVLADQWRTFLVAIAGISLLMLLAVRDVRLAVLALVPNTFPVLIVLGAMGWLHLLVWPSLTANMGTAMIAAVSLGLSIDSSLHYLRRYQDSRQRGLSTVLALMDVQRSVGKSLVLSTIALAVGFTVLASSQFVPTIYFGVLVTLAMLGGLAGNLVALPVLIQLVHRD